MPIRKAPWLNRFGWRTALVGVTTSAVLAVWVVPAILRTEAKPQLSDAYAAPAGSLDGDAGRQPVPTGLDWEQLATDNGDWHTCAAGHADDCIVVRGTGPHVLLIGDSQAMSFVPMFEEQAAAHDLTLSLNVIAGCPWQEGLANDKQADDTAQTCEAGRVGWYDTVLPELDPDVVVLLERPRDDAAVWGGAVRRRDGRQQPLATAVYQTTRDSLAKITKVAGTTLIVQRLVMPETFDPLDCLASASTVGECAVGVSIDPSNSDGFAAAAAAKNASIRTVNLNDIFCTGLPVCLPMDGDQVVWRDDHHYTAAYVSAKGDAVWGALQEAGAFSGLS
ncbi:MAG: SGNH hydrolase domain-containing protein [Nocardioides sp.]